MTITDAHRDSYQATVAEFSRQSREDTCLPVTILNILDELADRHEKFENDLELDDLLELCDYQPGFGSSAEFLPDRLAPLLEESNYTVTIETNLTLGDLETILEDQNTSYPIAELDPQYFYHAEGYEIQKGQFGVAMPHTVIPYKFNTDTMLYYDPYEDFYASEPAFGAPPSEMSKVQFYELWSGKAQPQWTLWVEQSDQRTLNQFEGES